MNFPLQIERDYDFLNIYDGLNDTSPLIERLSGNLGSFNKSSIGNTLFLKFTSDSSNHYKGFQATIDYGMYIV